MTHITRIAGIMLMAWCIAGCSADPHAGHDHEHDHEPHDHGTTAAADAHADEEEGDEIILEPAMAQRLGVEVQTLEPAAFAEVIPASGTILPSPVDMAVAAAPTAGRISLRSVTPGTAVGQGAVIATVSASGLQGGDTNQAARVALEAARREYERAVPLHEAGVVSDRDFRALEASLAAAEAAYSPAAASGSVTSPIGGVVTEVLVGQGEVVAAGQPVARITRSGRLTLQADLPQRYAQLYPTLTGANIRVAGTDRVVPLADHGGTRLSTASATASGGYIPVTFTFDHPGAPVVPGAVVDVYLLGAQRPSVLAVPVGAITEQSGAKYVYVRVDDHGYERRAVTTGGSDGRRVEITSGLAAGDQVVVSGASAVRLAENSGNVPEGHTH